MSAEAIKNNQAPVTQGPQIYSDRKSTKGTQDDPTSSNGSSAEDLMKEELEKILELYEQSKAKIVEKLLSDANDNKTDESDLAKAIALTQGSTSASNVFADHSAMAKDIENFFMLIFKYLNADNQGQSKLQIAQAVNSESKENMINSVTKGMMTSLSDMKVQIKKAYDKEHSALGTFLKIVLPIIVTVICLAAALFTGGASVAGAAAADAALTGATEAATVATEAATTAATATAEGTSAATAACADAVSGGGAEALSTGADAAQEAANTAEEAATNAEQAATKAESFADKALQAVSDNPGDQNTEDLANNAVQKAQQARTLAEAARANADVAQETATTMRSAATDAVGQTPSKVAEIAEQAQSQISSKVTTMTEDFSETEAFRPDAVTGGRAAQFVNALKTNTAETLSNTFLSKGMLIGAGAAGGTGFGAYSAANSSATAEFTAETSEATNLQQGIMAVDSSASQGLQTDVQTDMQTEKSSLDQQQSDQSMMQQAIQKEASIYTAGSFNA